MINLDFYNKLYPIIIFNIAKNNSRIPIIPIPLYLDENITNMVITSMNKNMYISTESKSQFFLQAKRTDLLQNVKNLLKKNNSNNQNNQKVDNNEYLIKQRPLNNGIHLTFQCKNSSIMFSMINALIDNYFCSVLHSKTSICFFYRNIYIYNGKITNYNMSVDETTDLANISLGIEYIKNDLSENMQDLQEQETDIVNKNIYGLVDIKEVKNVI